MVSKARPDLPEPDSPVTRMGLWRGMSREMFFRLCTRAPCTAMVVRAAARAVLEAALEDIRRSPQVDERQLLQGDVASPGELYGGRSPADEPLSSQVLACRCHSLHVEVPFEVGLDLGARPRFAHFAQVINHRPEQRVRPLRYVTVDRV